MTDWRLDFCKHLRGVRLRHAKWVQPHPDWDHDHCAACWRKFSDRIAPDVQHEGFATCEDYKYGADYDWVCEQCFRELKDVMGWRIEPN
jgi:hypothetical protein